MWSRRIFLKIGLGTFLLGWSFISKAWAKVKQLLPKGFPKNQLLNMNPAEVDNRNLEIDPLDKFGTMGPTDVAVDGKTYQLKITGKVEQPLSLNNERVRSCNHTFSSCEFNP